MRIVRLMLVSIIREKVIVVKNPKDHWSGCHSISFKSPVFAWSWSLSWQKCCSYKQEEDLVYIKMLCVCLYIQVLEQQSLTNVGSKRSFDSASDNALVQSLTYHVIWSRQGKRSLFSLLWCKVTLPVIEGKTICLWRWLYYRNYVSLMESLTTYGGRLNQQGPSVFW